MGIAVIGLVVIAAVVVVWFEPQQLFLDDRVSERSVTVEAELASGTLVSLDHETSGDVRVVDSGGGRRVVRLEAFATENGPDLYVYLSTNPADGDEGAFDDDIVSLGRLKGNLGDQNYEVPAGVDLDRFASVVIWCDRFDSAFGAADLAAA